MAVCLRRVAVDFCHIEDGIRGNVCQEKGYRNIALVLVGFGCDQSSW